MSNRNGSVYASDAVVKFPTPQPPRENTVSPPPELEVESTKSDWDEEEEAEDEEEELEEEMQQDHPVEEVTPEVVENPPAVSQGIYINLIYDKHTGYEFI